MTERWQTFAIILVLLAIAAPRLAAQSDRAPEAPLAQVEARLLHLKQNSGHGPSVEEFQTAVYETKLPVDQQWEAWQAFGRLHSPSVGKAELARIIEAKRSAIQSIDVKLQYRELAGTGDQALEVEQKWRFVSSGGRMSLTREIWRNSREDPERTGRTAYLRKEVNVYDGDVVQTYREFTTGFHGLVDFFRYDSPLGQADYSLLAKAMLWDGPASSLEAAPLDDLMAMLRDEGTVVLEEPQIIAGVSTIVVSNRTCDVHLDPARNYAVVQVVTFHAGEAGNRRLWFHRLLTDLVDYGQGIWLPNSITETDYSLADGQAAARLTFDVERCSINRPTTVVSLREVAPPDMMMIDTTRGHQSYPLDEAPEDAAIVAHLRPAIVKSLATRFPDDGHACKWTMRSASSNGRDYVLARREKLAMGRHALVATEEVAVFDSSGQLCGVAGGRINAEGTRGQTIGSQELGDTTLALWATMPEQREGFTHISELSVLEAGLPTALRLRHYRQDTIWTRPIQAGATLLIFTGPGPNHPANAKGAGADGREYLARLEWDDARRRFVGPTAVTIAGQKYFSVELGKSAAFQALDQP